MKTIDMTKLSSDVTLMVWDTNPRTWNKPNRETNVNSKVKINEGDILLLRDDEVKVTMTVNKVIDNRPSSLKGYTYYELLTTRNEKQGI